MDLRKMMLPPGWYPQSELEARRQLDTWKRSESVSHAAVAAVVPHAGWSFSGEMAWEMIRQIPEDTELIIIAGGHLYAGAVPLILDYDALDTPFGPLSVDKDAAEELCSDFNSDRTADNTVEIQLPMVKYHLPTVRILPVRLPPDSSSSEWSARAADILKKRKVFLLGSTDLSHYGILFAYTDYGFGESARDKIRNIDTEFLESLRVGEINNALNMADSKKCACSAGAAAAAASFAGNLKASGEIRDQRYSYEVLNDGGDFVGYGTLLYCC